VCEISFTKNANSRENFCGGAGTTNIQHPAAYISNRIGENAKEQEPNHEKGDFFFNNFNRKVQNQNSGSMFHPEQVR